MYLGIDLGTSSVKVVLLNDEQTVYAQADAPLGLSRPNPLWSEQDPQTWWNALEQVMVQLRANLNSQGETSNILKTVKAIGLSGQMHGAVLLDRNQRVLRPAILWNDGRSLAQCQLLEQKETRSRLITGNLAMPGFTAPKLLWVREHEPEIFQQIAKVLLPKDWLRLRLTGDCISDMSDASGTLWLDVAKRAWSEPMLNACDFSEHHMPKLAEGSQASGTLSPALARHWGLSANVVVAAGAGDNAASAIGLGVVSSEQGFVSLGTSGVIFRATDKFRPAAENAVHAFAHALPNRWHQMSVMLSAASALTWVTGVTGMRNEAQLLTAVGQLNSKQRNAAPIFLPYLSGERTPHNNPHSTGVFMGLRLDHHAADLAFAVLEGVSFGLKDGLKAMDFVPPLKVPLGLVGGGARDNGWAQMLATILNSSLCRYEGAHHAAAVGAARLGMMANGCLEDEVCTRPKVDSRFDPIEADSDFYQARYQRFTRLYLALEHEFR
jgi:xylulokinase